MTRFRVAIPRGVDKLLMKSRRATYVGRKIGGGFSIRFYLGAARWFACDAGRCGSDGKMEGF